MAARTIEYENLISGLGGAVQAAWRSGRQRRGHPGTTNVDRQRNRNGSPKGAAARVWCIACQEDLSRQAGRAEQRMTPPGVYK